jgi:archaellum component FlaD/FlaE
MFSWKNIKTTVRQKVINGEDNSQRVLGIAEALGKTIVSGATSVVKAAPMIASAAMDNVIKNSKDDDQINDAKEKKEHFDQQMRDRKERESNTPSKEDIELQKYKEELKQVRNKLKQDIDIPILIKLLKKEATLERIIRDYEGYYN